MRNIYIVNANQVVTSEAHPEGIYSVLPDYPKLFDSRAYNATEANPNGDTDLALIVAQAEYADRVKQLSLATNRAMWTVTLETADGKLIMRKAFGAFPDMTPTSEESTESEQGE